jgi:ubiquinone/menaquinone biosynthesis C-methylase UbiE
MIFSDNFFDLVTAIETYYFWNSFSDASREIRRVLKRNGNLLLVNEMVKDGKYDIKHVKTIERAQVNLIPLDKIRYILYAVGFDDVQTFKKAESPWNAILAKKC